MLISACDSDTLITLNESKVFISRGPHSVSEWTEGRTPTPQSSVSRVRGEYIELPSQSSRMWRKSNQISGGGGVKKESIGKNGGEKGKDVSLPPFQIPYRNSAQRVNWVSVRNKGND